MLALLGLGAHGEGLEQLVSDLIPLGQKDLEFWGANASDCKHPR